MRCLLLALVAVVSAPANAVFFDWPSTSCAGTLQACINAAASGDEIGIRTEATINEDLSINRSLKLSATGSAALFGAGRTISLEATTDGVEITLENLIVNGPISGTVGSNIAGQTQRINFNSVQVRALTAGAINIASAGTAASSYTINIRQSTLESQAPSRPAVQVLASFGVPLINITQSEISSQYDGISLDIGTGRANVIGNRIGRIQSANSLNTSIGISVTGFSSSTAVAPVLQANRNVIFNYGTGILPQTITAGLDVRILNNTIVNSALYAIELSRRSGGGPLLPLTGRIANNLISRTVCGLSYRDEGATATADYNFYHALGSNTCAGAPTGANDRTGTPRFVGGFDFRTLPGSPNHNVGNNADQPVVPIIFVTVPATDFDNRNGRVNGTVDIGAFEFSGERSQAHTSAPGNITLNQTALLNPIEPLFESDLLQLGQFGRDIDRTPSLPSNLAGHLGMWYRPDNVWSIFEQDNVQSFASGRKFFVLLNLTSNENLLHTASSTNSAFNTTTLDHPQLNDQPGAIPIVTQHYQPPSVGPAYNNTSVGVWYDDSTSPGRWKVFNQRPVIGGAPGMPSNASFNVLIPNALFANGAHAFRVSPLAVPVSVRFLDNPYLNNNACAHPYVTATYNPNSVYVPANLVLSYNPASSGRGAWAIERGDGQQIPAGASFHVYVDPQQSRRCQEPWMQRDGFE